MRNWWGLLAAIAAVLLLSAGCGSDDDTDSGGIVDDDAVSTTDDATTDEGNDESDDSEGSADAGNAGSSGGDAGSMVLGDETIVFTLAQCFLEEQDSAGGGGKILFVAQGSGTNAAGEAVLLDVSRFDEDSQFTGDKSNAVIGDPFSDSAISWDANGDIGTVSVDGSTVSADGLTWMNTDDFSEQPGSFVVNC